MIISLPFGLILALGSKGDVDFNDVLLFLFGASMDLFRLATTQPYISLAKRSRMLADEAVGLIVDNFLSLRVL
jgi:hypothetical protein